MALISQTEMQDGQQTIISANRENPLSLLNSGDTRTRYASLNLDTPISGSCIADVIPYNTLHKSNLGGSVQSHLVFPGRKLQEGARLSS